MLLDSLYKEEVIHPPKWLINNTMYLTMMGSEAYGASSNNSDVDVYGFCIPYKDQIFPHLRNEIPGFGTQIQRFDQWQEHHIQSKSRGKEYDISVYSIIKLFQLALENNPNILESIFTPRRCVLHTTPIAEYVRENRKLFLHKGAMHKFRGYFFQQLNRYRVKDKIKEILKFQNSHSMQNLDVINNLRNELSRRGLNCGIFNNRFNR